MKTAKRTRASLIERQSMSSNEQRKPLWALFFSLLLLFSPSSSNTPTQNQKKKKTSQQRRGGQGLRARPGRVLVLPRPRRRRVRQAWRRRRVARGDRRGPLQAGPARGEFSFPFFFWAGGAFFFRSPFFSQPVVFSLSRALPLSSPPHFENNKRTTSSRSRQGWCSSRSTPLRCPRRQSLPRPPRPPPPPCPPSRREQSPWEVGPRAQRRRRERERTELLLTPTATGSPRTEEAATRSAASPLARPRKSTTTKTTTSLPLLPRRPLRALAPRERSGKGCPGPRRSTGPFWPGWRGLARATGGPSREREFVVFCFRFFNFFFRFVFSFFFSLTLHLDHATQK